MEDISHKKHSCGMWGQTDIRIEAETLNRIREVSSFSDEDRQHVFSVIDAFIAKKKIQSII